MCYAIHDGCDIVVEQAVIDYLKIDIDGTEFAVLKNLGSTDILTRIKQIGLEIHPMHGSTSQIYYYWTVLEMLATKGFRRWYWAMNYRNTNLYQTPSGIRSCCYEMVYINTRFLDKTRN